MVCVGDCVLASMLDLICIVDLEIGELIIVE